MISKEFLSKIPVFQKLDPKDLDVLSELWFPRRLETGEILYRKGEIGTSMVFIESGTIRISVPILRANKEMEISLLHAGNFLGELALIDGLPRTATATAIEPCRIYEMKREDFLSFLVNRPSVAILMMSEIGRRLRSTNELVQSLASKNVNEELEEKLNLGERLSDKIASFGGSWGFIISFSVLVAIWFVLNTVQFWFEPFDPFPYIFLNLMLSCLAAIQAPIIMMSQNRAQKKDRLKAELDYQVNLKSELLLQNLHIKFDELRSQELRDIHKAVSEDLKRLQDQIQSLSSQFSERS
ncbi:MAG: DUF1003 domain-containing protein [Ignavibacteria bacterium]|nr:DUF1003 domain-containing protein [Ignavibacteria bacterium]